MLRSPCRSLLWLTAAVAVASACADGAAPPTASGSADTSGELVADSVETPLVDAAVAEMTADGASVSPDTAAGTPDGAGDPGPSFDPGPAPDVVADADAAPVPDSGPVLDSAPDSGPAPDTTPDVAPTCKPTNPPTEACDGVDNDCDGKTDDKSCDDGNTCTTDSCAGAGGCQFSALAPCEDGNQCTDDSCDPKAGCKNAANTGGCDDGSACTTEACVAGACKATAKVCDDGDVCTSDSCDLGSGTCLPGLPKTCDDSNPCTDDACDKSNGCQGAASAGGCDDGNACTSGDACKDKACAAGAAVDCDDKNPCTTDSCDKAKGCQHVNNASACDDGDPCTTQVCAAGACKATSKACDDKDACTGDSCDGVNGNCVHTALANCKACTTAGNCDDANTCTTDTCAAGKCSNAAVAGCLGPTDFVASNLTGVPAKTDPKSGYPGKVFSITLNNLGKQPTSGSISFEWWVSKQPDLKGDASTKAKVGTGNTVLGSAVTPNNPKSISLSAAPPFTNLAVPITSFTHVCVVALWANDAKPIDNHACAPTQFVVAEGKVVGIAVKGSSKPLAETVISSEQVFTLDVTYDLNSELGAGYDAKFQVYFSKDDQFDAADTPSVNKIGTVSTGTGKVTATSGFSIPANWAKSQTPTDTWICVQYVFGAPAVWNPSPADDTLCLPTKVFQPTNVKVTKVYDPAVTSVNQVAKFGLVFGVLNACTADFTNTTAAVTGPFDVRCTLDSVAGTALATVDWSATGLAAKASGNLGSAPFTPAPDKFSGLNGTASYLWCAKADFNGKLVETTTTDNKVCTPVTVWAPDYKNVTTTVGAGPVKPLGKVDATWLFENVGNHAGAKGYSATIYWSGDDKLDAADLVVKTWTGLPAVVAPAGKACMVGTCSNFADKQIQIPLAAKPGTGFLLFAVDSGNLVPEFKEDNNVTAVPFTVIP